jgi:hypothetical protein
MVGQGYAENKVIFPNNFNGYRWADKKSKI